MQAAVRGAAGQYKVKSCDDICVETGAISRSALTRYRKTPAAGARLSLLYLFGQDARTPVSQGVAAALLGHFWHVYKLQPCFAPRRDSLATLALGLCGWHRHGHVCMFRGTRMTLLQRAVLDEEAEFKYLAARFRDGEALQSEARNS